MKPALIVVISIAYVCLLFGLAFWTERQERKGKSLVNNPYIYALSLAVYCTAWTFYGSVGKAATSGLDFLPIYLGPTIAATLWWFVLRKIILISKSQRITSIADFISSRYGKSTTLGVMATIIAIFCIIPYISIQLKAVAVSYDILSQDSVNSWSADAIREVPFYLDTAWYIAIFLAVFTILFGTRNLDPNERHEGMVAAVAFESIFKLVAFLSIGIFVTYGMFGGFGNLFSAAEKVPEIARVMFMENSQVDGWYWFWLTILSMFAIMFLPRQFHIAVVENTNPNFIKKAAWLFPLYLLLINIFVLPIALGGMLQFGPEANADMFVLSLPLAEGKEALAFFVALGGFSASMGMVVVAVTALGIMISNNLVMPTLLSSATIQDNRISNIFQRLLGIRRVSVVVVLILSYGYFKFVSSQYTLVSIGLISFAGVAQFAPIIIGGIFWKKANRLGAICGLLTGFLTWAFCLPFPTLAEGGLLDTGFIDNGLFGLSWLKPYSLFGMEDLHHVSHGAFWSLLLNTLIFVGVSLFTNPKPIEISQADIFVDIYKYEKSGSDYEVIRRQAKVSEIRLLLIRFLGQHRANRILRFYEAKYKRDLSKMTIANEDLIGLTETHLAGSIGAASAKIILASIVKEDPISLEEMFKILEQTQEIIQYSRQLEQKSNELQATTQQLQEANTRLKELDLLKADFVTTVTHELRTPITSIKSLAKILHDNPEIPEDEKNQYLGIIVSESERITRLVNQVLDLEKLQDLESRHEVEVLDLAKLAGEAYNSVRQMMEDKSVSHSFSIEPGNYKVEGFRDQLLQAILNLLSNAIKFCDAVNGQVQIRVFPDNQQACLEVRDNGKGIKPENLELIFERFTQLTDDRLGKPKGSGLGLPITLEIAEKHGGSIRVENLPQSGARFTLKLPLKVR